MTGAKQLRVGSAESIQEQRHTSDGKLNIDSELRLNNLQDVSLELSCHNSWMYCGGPKRNPCDCWINESQGNTSVITRHKTNKLHLVESEKATRRPRQKIHEAWHRLSWYRHNTLQAFSSINILTRTSNSICIKSTQAWKTLNVPAKYWFNDI